MIQKKEYLIVHKSILPEFYYQIIRARDLVDNEGYTVSAACHETNISRSTFYKYKDYIFYPSKDHGRKAIFSFKAHDRKGVLSNILNIVYENKGSVFAINQNIPIKETAYVTLTIDMHECTDTVEELLAKFKKVKGVKTANVLAIE